MKYMKPRVIGFGLEVRWSFEARQYCAYSFITSFEGYAFYKDKQLHPNKESLNILFDSFRE